MKEVMMLVVGIALVVGVVLLRQLLALIGSMFTLLVSVLMFPVTMVQTLMGRDDSSTWVNDKVRLGHAWCDDTIVKHAYSKELISDADDYMKKAFKKK